VPPPRARSASYAFVNLALPATRPVPVVVDYARQHRLHLEHVEHAIEVERLIVDPDMITLVEIHPDAELGQCRICLRRPGGSRLTVAGGRRAEDPSHVPNTLLLAPVELRDPLIPSRMLEVHGNRRLAAVCIRVIANFVLPERGDHVGPASLLEHARLLADYLERRLDARLRQCVCHALGRSVILRQDVVLGVEPQRDVNGGR
jgi:hypothetical protein